MPAPPGADRAMLKTLGVAAFALLAVYGFAWMLYTMAVSSTSFFLTLDGSPGSLALAAVAAVLVAGTYYFVFYPEGQKAYP